MASRTATAPGLALLAAILLLGACGDLTQSPSENDGGMGLGWDADVPEDTRWAPESALLGDHVIPVEEPSRCRRHELSAAGDEALQDLAFDWEPSGMSRVYAAVFRDPPIVDSTTRTISNAAESVIWAWRTGAGQNDTGHIRWADGHAPDARGLPDLAQPPPTDLSGYDPLFWFVTWAYDDADRQLKWSSEARPFFVVYPSGPDAGYPVTDGGYRTTKSLCCDDTEADLRLVCVYPLDPEQQQSEAGCRLGEDWGCPE